MIHKWDEKVPFYRLSSWLFDYERWNGNNFLLWIGPWHLAISPIDR